MTDIGQIRFRLCLTVVALRPGASPVSPSPLRCVRVAFDHGGDEACVAD